MMEVVCISNVAKQPKESTLISRRLCSKPVPWDKSASHESEIVGLRISVAKGRSGPVTDLWRKSNITHMSLMLILMVMLSSSSSSSTCPCIKIQPCVLPKSCYAHSSPFAVDCHRLPSTSSVHAGISKNEGHLIWTQNDRIPYQDPKRGPAINGNSPMGLT